MGQVLRPVAPPDHATQRQAEHHAREQPAGEEGGDRHAGDRSDGDQDEARRDGLCLRAGRGEERDEVTRLGAALFHLGEQHGSHRGHVGRLRPGDARHEVHGADEHIVQPAANMAQKARQEGHHGARHAGHLDEQTEEDEQRHRE